MSKQKIKRKKNNFIRKTFWISEENQKTIDKNIPVYKISESRLMRGLISKFEDEEKPAVFDL